MSIGFPGLAAATAPLERPSTSISVPRTTFDRIGGRKRSLPCVPRPKTLRPEDNHTSFPLLGPRTGTPNVCEDDALDLLTALSLNTDFWCPTSACQVSSIAAHTLMNPRSLASSFTAHEVDSQVSVNSLLLRPQRKTQRSRSSRSEISVFESDSDMEPGSLWVLTATKRAWRKASRIGRALGN